MATHVIALKIPAAPKNVKYNRLAIVRARHFINVSRYFPRPFSGILLQPACQISSFFAQSLTQKREEQTHFSYKRLRRVKYLKRTRLCSRERRVGVKLHRFVHLTSGCGQTSVGSIADLFWQGKIRPPFVKYDTFGRARRIV